MLRAVCVAATPWRDLNHCRSRSTNETTDIGTCSTDRTSRVMRSNVSSAGVSRIS
jgi:hypothetical protein